MILQHESVDDGDTVVEIPVDDGTATISSVMEVDEDDDEDDEPLPFHLIGLYRDSVLDIRY